MQRTPKDIGLVGRLARPDHRTETRRSRVAGMYAGFPCVLRGSETRCGSSHCGPLRTGQRVDDQQLLQACQAVCFTSRLLPFFAPPAFSNEFLIPTHCDRISRAIGAIRSCQQARGVTGGRVRPGDAWQFFRTSAANVCGRYSCLLPNVRRRCAGCSLEGAMLPVPPHDL